MIINVPDAVALHISVILSCFLASDCRTAPGLPAAVRTPKRLCKELCSAADLDYQNPVQVLYRHRVSCPHGSWLQHLQW